MMIYACVCVCALACLCFSATCEREMSWCLSSWLYSSMLDKQLKQRLWCESADCFKARFWDVPIRSQRAASGPIKAFFNWSVPAVLSYWSRYDPFLFYISCHTGVFTHEAFMHSNTTSATPCVCETPHTINDSKTQYETVYLCHLPHLCPLVSCQLSVKVSYVSWRANELCEQKGNKSTLLTLSAQKMYRQLK